MCHLDYGGMLNCKLLIILLLYISIGTIFMPPKWALGYHQCRWSYASDQRVLEVHPFDLFHFMIYSLISFFFIAILLPQEFACSFSMLHLPITSNSYLLNLLIEGPYNFAGCKNIQRKGYTLRCDMDGYRLYGWFPLLHFRQGKSF